MKLLGVIKLAHQIIARSLNFFLINALILAGLLVLGFGLFYFSLSSGPTLVLFLLYPFLALLFYMYVAAVQNQYYRPRLGGEGPFPTVKEACRGAKKQWLALAIMALIITAVAFLFLNLPALWAALYSKINPLRTAIIPSFPNLMSYTLKDLINPRPIAVLIFYSASYLLVYLMLPLFALGFTAISQGEGFKATIKNLRAYFKAKPCSSILLYLFSLVIIYLFPCRLMSLRGIQAVPVIDVIFVGLQILIAFFILVYGLLMALVSQMILQQIANQEKVQE